jgi:hypothetical protein
MAVSPIAHVLHAAQLRDLADGPSFERGQSYHREGRVSALIREGKTVTATVSGSQTYRVKLWATGDRIAYACTCPVGEEGSFCKHCVAVALSLMEQLSSANKTVEEEVATAKVITPPHPVPRDAHRSVFLAGSIDMGRAANWQESVSLGLGDLPDVVIFNPRRRDGEALEEATVSNEAFCDQVTWELDALEAATVIAMYFEPSSQAPVTLLEMGLHAQSGRLIVCCPDGYWRKGNVDVVCRRYGVHQVHDLAALLRAVRARLTALGVVG